MFSKYIILRRTPNCQSRKGSVAGNKTPCKGFAKGGEAPFPLGEREVVCS